MKRIPLAALLALGALGLARADEGAYKNLVGMARAAATDRGPDAGAPPARAFAVTGELKDAPADVPNRASGESNRTSTAKPDAPSGGAPSGAVWAPAAARPRLWTRIYSTLLPPLRRPFPFAGEFDPEISTAPARAFMLPVKGLVPPPGSAAVSTRTQ